MYHFIFRFSLVLEVFFYYLFIRMLANGIHIIPACPKFTSPKQSFDLGMEPENFLCGYALDSSDYLFRRIPRNALNQKMDMVAIKADLQKMNLVPFLYSKADFLEGYRNLITKYLSPVFDRTNKMIQKQAFVVALVNMFTHTNKNTYHYATPEAEPRGILQIKIKTKGPTFYGTLCF